MLNVSGFGKENDKYRTSSGITVYKDDRLGRSLKYAAVSNIDLLAGQRSLVILLFRIMDM